MVGQQTVLVDKAWEIVYGWVGPLAGARGLNLHDWNAQLLECMYIITQLSM